MKTELGAQGPEQRGRLPWPLVGGLMQRESHFPGSTFEWGAGLLADKKADQGWEHTGQGLCLLTPDPLCEVRFCC